MLHTQQCAKDIGVECRGVAFAGLVGERSGLTLGASVVDSHIELAEASYSMIDEVLDIAFATHIGLDKFCICSERSQLSGKFLSFVRVTP